MLGTGPDWADGSEERVRSILSGADDLSSTSDELAEKIHDWPTRYHFSRLRSKVLSPLRVEPGTRVLDVGGGTGPISRRLGELGAEVVLLDGSESRARTAAERCRDLENVSVAVGTLSDLDPAKPFDLVLAIGVLEYADEGAVAMLRQAASLLTPAGAVGVAIENAIGLKYLLGYAEDHVGLPWVGWEGYVGVDQVRTYSRRELGSLLQAAGLTEHAWFYPFPDYKLPTSVMSDPAYEEPDVVDALVPQPCAPEASLPVLLADARSAHRTMLRAGLGREIANSFFVVASPTADGLDAHVDRETLVWLAGAERASRFMRSRRVVAVGARLAIVDDSVPPEEVSAGWLTQRRFAEVPFASGQPLDLLVSEALVAADADRTRQLLGLWTEALRRHAFAAPEQGGTPSPFAAAPGSPALPGDFLDSQPGNFIYADGTLERIDTEWEATGSVDLALVCIRALYHFAVDVFTRGISTQRAGGRDVASVVIALAEAAGIDDRVGALERLPAAEGALQALVRGWPEARAAAEIQRILVSSPRELTVEAGVPFGSPTGREREAELEAELEQLRQAHEAQGRQMIAQRLALAEQVEHELTGVRAETSALREEIGGLEEQIGGLREEIAWRADVMERQGEAIEHQKHALESILASRWHRLGAPLRRIARLLRR